MTIPITAGTRMLYNFPLADGFSLVVGLALGLSI
jgi:hypothetical protein